MQHGSFFFYIPFLLIRAAGAGVPATGRGRDGRAAGEDRGPLPGTRPAEVCQPSQGCTGEGRALSSRSV